MSQSDYSSQQLNNYPSDVDVSSRATSAIDYKQAIYLIKSILGLEYCLQYQIIPLSIKQNCLSLGMVNPEDQTALNFVRPIVNALGYGLTLQGIDSYTHQLILAEYLKQNHASGQPNKPDKDNNSEQTIAEIASQASSREICDLAMTITEIPFEPKQANQEKDLHDKPTLIRLEDSFGMPRTNIKASLEDDPLTVYAPMKDDLVEVDTPSKPTHKSAITNNQELTYTQTDEFSHNAHLPQTQMPGGKTSKEKNYPVKDPSPGNESAYSQHNSEQILDVKAELIRDSVKAKSEQNLEQRKTPLIESSSDFDISIPSSNYNSMKSKQASEGLCLPSHGEPCKPLPSQGGLPWTREAFSILSPRQLWQELLTTILNGGIGRLYLERDRDRGRILWSQEGVVQSSFDNVSLPILQALINEVKTLARVPREQLKKPKKIAIEKHHQQERLLLRIEMFPGQWGDEITIQVLRGKALKFYEQRQMKKMTEQALNLAQKLEKTLTKMRVCFDSAEIGDLSELQKVQQEINRQLKLLDQ